MKEKVYDEQIFPLMAQICSICKEHKIAFIADFALDDDLKCTSANLSAETDPTENQMRALQLLKPKHPIALAETIETLPNGSKKITIQRVL